MSRSSRLGAEVLRARLLDRTVLELNTLGDGESRTAYRRVLVGYFSDHRDALADSRERLERNPLRILDSKDRATARSSPAHRPSVII